MQAKTLFQLTTELTESKVEIAVSKAISQVVDQIVNLRQEVSGLRTEMHYEIGKFRQEVQQEISELKHDMIDRFSKVESRLSSVETALGKRNLVRGELRARFYDSAFKAGWLMLGSAMTFFAIHFHNFI